MRTARRQDGPKGLLRGLSIGGPLGRRAAGLAALALFGLVATPLRAQTIAITGGTVYPVSGPKIEQGTVLIQDGKIVAVGTGLAIPAGATRIDATGKWVTPGLIDAASDLGLRDVGSVPGTNEARETGDINAAFNVAEGIDPASVPIPVARIAGVTSALSLPRGGLIAGQAAFIDLDGERIEDLVARSPVAMVIDLSENSKEAGGGSRAGVLERLRHVFDDAREYQRRKPDFRKRQMQDLAAPAADLEALSQVLAGSLPVYALANRRSDIENSLRIAREYGLRLVILGGTEAWQVAPELAAAHVPVAVYPLTDIPSFDGLGARLDNAALLRKAGVPVMVVENEEGGPRDLRFAAGHAVRDGLPWEDALRAVTLAPALAFGLSGYGSLEKGKVANLVVWSGDPFEFDTAPEHVLIRGREIPLVSRQTELRERYRTLPPNY